MASEAQYNRCRYAVLYRGMVGMYQVGSPTLGQLVGADDIEKAAVGWDVFKSARLLDLKVMPPTTCAKWSLLSSTADVQQPYATIQIICNNLSLANANITIP